MHLLFATSIVPDGALALGLRDRQRRDHRRFAPRRRARHGARLHLAGQAALRSRKHHRARLRRRAHRQRADRCRSSPGSPRRVADRPDLLVGEAARWSAPSELRAAIDEAGPFDGYVLNSVQFAGAFEGLFDDRPSIFVAHNVEHRLGRRRTRSPPTGALRSAFCSGARRGCSRRSRRGSAGRARFVFTLADEDRVALGVASDAKSAALPLVTRPPRRRRRPPRRIGLRRGADRHLDLAAQPHRPRLVPG